MGHSRGCTPSDRLLESSPWRMFWQIFDLSDEPGMHPVSDLELLHYVDILFDHQLLSQRTYRDKAWPHVYILLRRFAVPSPLRCDAKFLLGAIILQATYNS